MVFLIRTPQNRTLGNVQVGQMFEFVESLKAMLRSFSQAVSLTREYQ